VTNNVILCCCYCIAIVDCIVIIVGIVGANIVARFTLFCSCFGSATVVAVVILHICHVHF